MHARIVDSFDRSIEAAIERADQRISELMANRPSPEEVRGLEDSLAAIDRQMTRVLAPQDSQCSGGSRPACTRSLAEDLRLTR
jgi:hypothetical protein